jgi:hypothetical protein
MTGFYQCAHPCREAGASTMFYRHAEVVAETYVRNYRGVPTGSL